MVKDKELKTSKKSSRPKEKKKTPVKKEEVKQEAVLEKKEKERKEAPAVSEKVETSESTDKLKRERYFEAVGRRKTSIARARLYTKPGDFLVNEKLYSVYFPTVELQKIVEDSLQKMKLFGRFKVTIKVSGGGVHSQAEAVRHGLARCLTKFNPDFRKRLRRAGFLTRDSRMKERKKFGLKGARKAPQWAKR